MTRISKNFMSQISDVLLIMCTPISADDILH